MYQICEGIRRISLTVKTELSKLFNFLILYIKTFFHKKNKKGLYFSNNLYVHEDTFWSYFATLFHDNFKLPDKEDCLKFAFDGNPDFYYKKNNLIRYKKRVH